jgi:hypothetical protein
MISSELESAQVIAQVIDFLSRLPKTQVSAHRSFRFRYGRTLKRLGYPLFALISLGLVPGLAYAGSPNGTWLSRPQIWFHASNNSLEQVMQRIKGERYRYVFLDVRNLTDAEQQRASQAARQQQLTAIAWVQSPQYRQLTVEQIINEARHVDGLQVDDHFFSHYSLYHFNELRARYNKPIFCSIQPFQARLVPPSGCDQVDVQCYTPQQFSYCVGLADRLNAVVSLATSNTLRYQPALNGRTFNVFLWPHTDEYRR